jgi:dTDP-4-dehydrorhamnose 3,5-epimerase
MIFLETGHPEVHIIQTETFIDDRGNFFRAYSQPEFDNAPFKFDVSAINVSKNFEVGTIRGLHRQTQPFDDAKIVRCISGSIFDVAVDVRPESHNYLQTVCVELSSFNNLALYIPPGFAHGFQTLEPNSIVQYCTDKTYNPQHETGFRYDDVKLSIRWPLKITRISKKDLNWPLINGS